VSLDKLLSFLRDMDPSDAFTLVAYFTFALTGALAGMKRGYDVIGVVFLAMITAAGGGLIRDGVLISNGPVALLTDGRILIAVLLASFAAFVFHRFVHKLAKTIALGLGVFVVHGVQVSLDAHLSVPGAILGGTMTAVGGGLLRDILVREEPLLLKPGQFYALVAIGGCGLFLALIEWSGRTTEEAGLITVVSVTVVRLLAIRFNWRTTAVYTERPPPPPS
jgi:uncharacterized membrane protein YeiH